MRMRHSLALLALALATCGCQNIQPSSVRTGLVFREAYGRWKVYNKHENVPYGRIQANFDVAEKTDAWMRMDYTHGQVDVHQYFTDAAAEGSMASIGGGLSYFPTKHISLDAGAELFTANVESLRGTLGPIHHDISDRLYGGGITFGITGELPVTSSVFIFGTAGYTFTESWSREAGYDFDGYFAGFGVGLKFK